jgi:phosphoribosylformimino-5-aminoimidazole carboxamide ribotide isomerase
VRIAGAGVRIIPVLDVMNGVVVRAVGGHRSEYRSIVSKLTTSTDPVAVAKALLEVSGADELYVADLDAIQHGCPSSPRPPGADRGCGGWLSPAINRPLPKVAAKKLPLSHEASLLLHHLPATVWLDIGLRDDLEAVHLKRFSTVRPILASETLGSRSFPPADDLLRLRPAFSIDLQSGELLSAASHPSTPLELAADMRGFGFRTFILLDLARVGMNDGPGTEALCTELRRRYPEVELLVGGGVRNRDDIKRLEDAGADGVLVASALHDGTLP